MTRKTSNVNQFISKRRNILQEYVDDNHDSNNAHVIWNVEKSIKEILIIDKFKRVMSDFNIEDIPEESITKEMEYVCQCLSNAREYGLEADVVTYALKHMKENPELSISQAMEAGMCEFDV